MTLKLKPVAYLLSLSLATPALAIGLGDLSVKSHLGQPLHATVKILSAPTTLDASCFSLRASDSGLAAPSQARFRIEPTGADALLHITTPQGVNDPIVQFVLSSDCEGRLQREYVLFLDPPMQIEPVRFAERQAQEAAPSASVASNAVSTPPRPAEVSTQSRPVARSVTTNPPPVASSGPEATQPRTAAPRKPAATTATARLVISGKNSLPETGSLPAGLEKEIAPPDQSNPRTANLTPVELSDENTALNRRLAHLEAQLAALHQRNAELEARLATSALAAPEAAAPQAPQWPLYLLGLGLVASVGGMVAWMRRRDQTGNEVAATILWTPPKNSLPSRDRHYAEPSMSQTDAMHQIDIPRPKVEPSIPDDQDIEEISLNALAEGTDVKDDIVDQAEVFVAHGYANLAINLLQEHLHQAPAESPVPWLLLLDLLLREGDEQGYAEASKECRRHFNVHFSDHPLALEQDGNRGLETYPHILEMLTRAWNTPDINTLFTDLIYDKRGGVRMGFEPGAYRDILLLRDIAQQKTLAMAA